MHVYSSVDSSLMICMYISIDSCRTLHYHKKYDNTMHALGEMTMAYNEVSKAATNKYRAKFSMIQIRVQQEERDRIAEHAASRGESMTAFIKRAVRETMERDNTESGDE